VDLSVRESAALDWFQRAAGEGWISAYPASVSYALRVIRRVLFPVPSHLEACLQTAQNLDFAEELYGSLLDEVLRSSPRTVGFSVAFSEQVGETIRLARLIRERAPATPILLGGSQINLLQPSQIDLLARSGVFDYIVTPNGEPAIVELVDGARRQECAEVVTTRAIGAKDLVGLPHPVFDSTDLYFRPLTIPVLATKGCYWGKCAFCDYVRLSDIGGKRYLGRPAEEALDEIVHAHDTWQPDRIMLISDAVPPSWYGHLAEAAIASGVHLRTWSYMMHHEHLDRPFFEKLKKAGVQGINFGTESTNDRILRLMRKQATARAIGQNLRDAHESGISVISNVIADYPTLTFEEALRVVADFEALTPWVDELNPSTFDLTAGTPAAVAPGEHRLAVPNDAYHRSSHGFHTLPFSAEGALNSRQTMVLRVLYDQLAAAVRLRRRVAGLGDPKFHNEDLLIFDRGAVAIASSPPTYKIPALGLSLKLEAWESTLVDRILDRAEGRIKVGDLRREVEINASNASEWLLTFAGSGLISQVDRSCNIKDSQ